MAVTEPFTAGQTTVRVRSKYMMNVFTERQNTLVIEFEMNSPRISAFDIHEWLHDNMKLQPQDVKMIQVNGTKRQVYLKLRDETLLNK